MKRRLARIGVFLALGAIVNIAVAWGFAWWIVPQKEYDTPYDEMAAFHVDVFSVGEEYLRPLFTGRHSIGTTWYWVFWLGPVDLPNGSTLTQARKELREEGYRPLPTWIGVGRVEAHEASQMQTFSDHALVIRGFGIPMRSMAAAMIVDYQDDFRKPLVLRRVFDGIQVASRAPGSFPFDDDRLRLLPLRPIWPGFTINTLFYALLLWLLFAGPGTARRALRRRRGLCEKCAYPIGVSPVCTECGATVVVRGEA